jgi:O-antigen/teichoic acid export membrane protein
LSETPEVGSAARGAALLMAAHASLMVAGYVIAVVLARGMGPVLYGVYGLICTCS